MRSGFYIWCLFCYSLNVSGQNLDSLFSLSNKKTNDTNTIKTLLVLADIYSYRNPDSAILFAERARKTAVQLKNSGYEAKALSELGWDYFCKGNLEKGMKFYRLALSINKKLNNKSGIAANLTSIANIYSDKGDYKNALEFYFKALRMDERNKDSSGIAKNLCNIGLLYFRQKDLDKALGFLNRSLKMATKMNMKHGISINLGNIGNIYVDYADASKERVEKERLFSVAVDYYQRALEIDRELGNTSNIIRQTSNLGSVCYSRAMNAPTKALKNEMFEKAEQYFSEALENHLKSGAMADVAFAHSNIGAMYVDWGKFTLAEKHLLQGLELSEKIGLKEKKRNIEKSLAKLYKLTARHKLALKHFREYIAVRDSLKSEETVKNQTRLEMQYSFDKKQATDSIQQAEQIKHNQLKREREIRQQKMYTYGGIGVCALMFVVAIISFRAFRNKQKSTQVIAQQKALVEEKQKEVLDSIYYARRIQVALLPSEKYLTKELQKLKR